MYSKEDFFNWVFQEENPIRSLFLEYSHSGSLILKSWLLWGIIGFFIILFFIISIITEEKDEDKKPREQILVDGTDVSYAGEGIIFLVVLGIIFFVIPTYVVKGLMLNDIYGWKEESPKYLEEYLKEDFNKKMDPYFKLSFLNSVIGEDGLFHYCLDKDKVTCKTSTKKIYQEKYIEAFKELKKVLDENNGSSYNALYLSRLYKGNPFIKEDEAKAHKYELIGKKLEEDKAEQEKREAEEQKSIQEEREIKLKKELENKKVTI